MCVRLACEHHPNQSPILIGAHRNTEANMVLPTKFVCLRDVMKSFPDSARCVRSINAGLMSICFVLLMGCGSGENGGDGPIEMAQPTATPSTSASASASASLGWEADPDPSIVGYNVHYGTQSPNSAGSCAYEQSTYFPLTSFANAASPAVTISNLTEGTTYYFSVSAYNGVTSACSNEVTKTT